MVAVVISDATGGRDRADTHGRMFTFKVPVHTDWSFDYTGTYTGSFNESGQIGNADLGLKGSISGSISIGLDISSPPLKVSVPLKFNLSATGYVGLAGVWTKVGSLDVYDNGSKFCMKTVVAGETIKLCI